MPVVCRDRAATPYEVTLELERDGTPYGRVGERCGWLLTRMAEGLAEARRTDLAWPDPDDRFGGGGEGEDFDILSLRHRHRTDVVGWGEFRCHVRTQSHWIAGQEGSSPGRWHRTRRAFVEAWGGNGSGVRAVLTSSQLAGFLEDVIIEAERLLGSCLHLPVIGDPDLSSAGARY